MHFLAEPKTWVLVAFIVFFWLAWKPLKKALLGALDGRAAKIRAQIEEAEKLREDAQHLLAEYQRKQRQAMTDVEAILTQAREEAGRLREKNAAQLKATLERRERQAMDRIAQAEAQALAEVRGAAADVAIAATRTLIAGAMDEARKKAMIDAAIKEIPLRLN
jgi:F-type H+-transporting ATPase subunit b